MKKKLFLTTLLCFLSMSWALAQGMTVTGTVTSADDGEPLIGATVQIKGTTKITTTNALGQYEIAANTSEVLVFQFTGAVAQEVTVSRNIIDVALSFADNQLEEVMVVAYGTAKKSGFTGSASSVKQEQIARQQVSSVSQLLAGNASGVQSISSIGQPGADAEIYIRGISTLSATNTPLYIVDGAPYDGSLNSINPADIESISVMKDASATSIYGARASNGLIIITTKQGKKDQQRPKIEASFKYGVSSRAQDAYKQVSTDQYAELTWEALYNQAYYVSNTTKGNATASATNATNGLVSRLGINPYGPSYPQPVGLDGKLVNGARALWNDNWVDEYESDATRLEARIAISGGSNKSSYYTSFSYLNDKGISPGSYFERYTGRVNLKTDLYKWLRFNTNINLTHSKKNQPSYQDSSSTNQLFQAMLTPSHFPVYIRDLNTGNLILDKDGKKQYDYGNNTNGGTNRPSGATPGWNALGTKDLDKMLYTVHGFTARGSAEIDLLPGLTYTGSINLGYENEDYHSFRNPTYGYYSTQNPAGSVSRYDYQTSNFTGNNIINYSTQIEKHSIKALFGQEYYQRNYKYFGGARSGVPSLGLEEPESGVNITAFTGNTNQYKLLGFFFNADYSYDAKYYLSASVRMDGSSRFYKDTRWGTFWSVGGSWRIKEESFLQNVNFLSSLTLRSSFGSQGNDGVGNYAYMGVYSVTNSLSEPAYFTARFANNDLKWETNQTFNVALDFGFFRNRLTGSFEFFNRKTIDMLFDVPMSTSTGYASYVDNAGTMRNRGIEAQITVTPIHTSDWRWDVSVNATHIKNKILTMPEDYITSYIRRTEGGSAYDWFLVEWAGVDSNDGMPRWWMTDASGNRVITDDWNKANNVESKVNFGSSLPDLNGGFSTSLSYKNINLSASFVYSIGGSVYDRDKSFILNTSSSGRAMSTELLNRWTPNNPNTNVPRVQTAATNWTSVSSRWLYDADYMRMKNLTISYSLPKKWLSKVFMADCRVYVQGDNLFTIFGPEGLDPEQIISGLSYFRYPNMRTLSAGIDITF